MASSVILIVGLARNCETVIRPEIEAITRSFSGFAATKWLVVESDSDDGTLDVLEDLRSGTGFDYITLGRLRDSLPSRTERIARCRNAYLDALENDSRYADIDFVAVADLDGVNAELTPASVRSCWEMAEDWDACFANQNGPYYDIWALRHLLWSPNDCWAQSEFLQAHGLGHGKAIAASVYSRMITISRDSMPITVESAFGGLGIYRRHLFDGCQYAGIRADGGEICEHVVIHAEMRRKGAQLLINPRLINSGFNDFSRTMQTSHRIRRSIRRTASGIISTILPTPLLARLRALRKRR